MKDLIDRQAAIKAIHYEFDECLVWDESGQHTADEMENILTSLPSADVQPVRHGHWVHDGLDIPHGVDWMHCSECGRRDKYCPAAMTNYCPSCGARMDGEA